ncbi:MAG TPA: 4-hydroxybenzoate octaprenyltransferase [Legionella sp.]|nr:4-hydroxybenzoate octaprenyltransferase [Legionella sp.]
MIKWQAYMRLLRLDKPVGILLLWYPTAWALWIANSGHPSVGLISLFFLGTVFMRSAGCVINDIADRNIDKYVGRTKLRPLAANEISLFEAFALLLGLLVCALIILINLPFQCFYWGMISVLITFLYPFCKRFINAPQLVLGLAFSMGIPMAFVASGVSFNTSMSLIFLINFMWIIAYDTMYAMVDKEDDLKIGVQSTAIWFGSADFAVISALLIMLHALWLLFGVSEGGHAGFYFIWFLAGWILIYQVKLISTRNSDNCFKSFLISSYYGALMWTAIMLL